jgi:ribosome biogenesis GTPase
MSTGDADVPQPDDGSPRRIDKRRNIEKLWRKGTSRWRYAGDGEADGDTLDRRRSTPRMHQLVRPENERDAIVIEMGGPSVMLVDGDEEIRARPRRSTTTRNPASSLVVIGDRVRYLDIGEGDAVITHVYARRTALSRSSILAKDVADVLVANIDLLVIVGAASNELLRPGLIDRYLIAAAMGGINACIVVNKMDLVDDEELPIITEIAEMYREAGYLVIFTSCVTGEGLEALHAVLKDQLSAFSGHSGVGKTSLLNRLVPHAMEKTSELSDQSQRGMHTTSKSVLYELVDGGFIADTPGIREFGLFFFDKDDLHTYYPEFLRHADHCRFPSCTHTHEPDCAVIRAVEDEEIHPLRYKNYLQILESEAR